MESTDVCDSLYAIDYNYGQGNSHDLAEELITCSICMGRLYEPKTLYCLHTFCLECLVKHLSTTNIDVPESCENLKCPVCRTSIPGEVVSNPHLLTTDFKIAKIVDLVESFTKKLIQFCSVCKLTERSLEAQFVCTDCDLCFCDDCVILHRAVEVFKDHILKPCSDKYCFVNSSNNIIMEENSFCNEHQTHPVSHYCLSCHVTICALCMLTDYMKHGVTDINMGKAFNSYAERITTMQEVNRKQLNLCHFDDFLALSAKKFAEETLTTVSDEIYLHYTETILKIKESRDSLLEEVKDLYMTKTDFILTFEEYNKSKFEKLLYFKSKLDSYSNYCGDINRILLNDCWSLISEIDEFNDINNSFYSNERPKLFQNSISCTFQDMDFGFGVIDQNVTPSCTAMLIYQLECKDLTSVSDITSLSSNTFAVADLNEYQIKIYEYGLDEEILKTNNLLGNEAFKIKFVQNFLHGKVKPAALCQTNVDTIAVLDLLTKAVVIYDTEENFITQYCENMDCYELPTAICTDLMGDIYVCDSGPRVIYCYTIEGNEKMRFDNFLKYPSSLCISAVDGSIFVHDIQEGCILKIFVQSNNRYASTKISGSKLLSVVGMGFDSFHNLFVCDALHQMVFQYSFTGDFVGTVIDKIDKPEAMCIDGNDRIIIITSTVKDNKETYKINIYTLQYS